MTIPYVAKSQKSSEGSSVNKHCFLVYYISNLINLLRQKLAHLKAQTSKHKQSSIINAINGEPWCVHLWHKTTHRKDTWQHRSWHVFMWMKRGIHWKLHAFKPAAFFKRYIKEAIYVNMEWPFLTRGGHLRCHQSSTYNAVVTRLLQHSI